MPTLAPVADPSVCIGAATLRPAGFQPVPVRPRVIGSPAHAGQVLRLAPRDRAVLPRWGINSPVRDHGADPGAYSATIGWTSRDHYLTYVIPAAITLHADVLARHHVSPDTLRRWAAAKTLYAQEQRCGRTVIVRPDTIAGILQTSKRQVQRCNAAAREMGIELVITPGRMLTEIETYKARKAGSPQRGLSTVSAFVVPRALVDHVTPTSGRTLCGYVKNPTAFKPSSARPKGAPLRSAPHQRRRGPAWTIAAQLTALIPWLRKCPPGRIQGQLSRFVITCPYPWTAQEILRAMDTINLRHNYNSPTRSTTAPWGLLGWYLRQIDEITDAPGLARAMEADERRRSRSRPVR